MNSVNNIGAILASACNVYFLDVNGSNKSNLSTIIKLLSSGDLNRVSSTMVDMSENDVYFNGIVSVLEGLKANVKANIALSIYDVRILLADIDGFSLYDSKAENPTIQNFMRPGVNSLYNTAFLDAQGKGGKRMITTVMDSNNNQVPESQIARRNVRKVIDSYSKYQSMTNVSLDILSKSALFQQFSSSDIQKFLSNSFKGKFEYASKWNGLLKSQEDSFAFPIKDLEKGLVGVLLFCTTIKNTPNLGIRR
jgi:hypothetical protein